jgi:flagellar assembly factor FliW
LIKVSTTRFSEIEVDEKEVIELPHVLLDHDKKESPFKWLQSLDDGAIAFVLINPLLFRPDYMVEVTEAEVSDLDLKSEEDAVISVIITMPSNPQNMTANLKAPLIFNLSNRRGKQLVLSNPDYATRHNIMEEVRRASADKQEAAVTPERIAELKQEHEAAEVAATSSVAKDGTTTK